MITSCDAVGEITFLVDAVDHCITRIIFSDVPEETVTDFLSDLARFFEWDFTITERYRYLLVATPSEKKLFYLYNFSEVHDVLIAEYRDLITDIHTASDVLTTALKTLINNLERSIIYNKERLADHEQERRSIRITGRDNVDRGCQEQSLDSVNFRIAQLQEKITNDTYVLNYLTTHTWDGLCLDCEEPVPIDRVLAAHSLHCLDCTRKKGK